MDEEFFKELRECFLEEAVDLLDNSGEQFLELEKNPNNREAMESILRVFHNIKGSANSVGLEVLSKFAHRSEDLLVKVRDGQIEFSAEVNDVLLSCNDALKDAVEKATENTDLGEVFRTPLEQIDRLEMGSEANRSEQATPSTTADEDPTILDCLRDQVTLLSTFGRLVQQARIRDEDIQFSPKVVHLLQGCNSSLKDAIEKIIDSPSVSVQEFDKEQNTDKTQKNIVGPSIPVSPSAIPPPPPVLAPPKKKMKEDSSIRLSTEKISNILDYFGEQVILFSKLGHLVRSDLARNEQKIFSTLAQLDKMTLDLQQTIVALRMVTLTTVFSRLERTVRDVAKKSGKKINFVKIGQESELDKTIVDSLVDPLTHMVRNAVDHGMEKPEERISVGKTEIGTVTLNACRKGGAFCIEVTDDGRGLDRDKILKKGIEKGLVQEEENLTDREIYQLIFQSGFSTRDQATDVSGRGVGMDVVREMFERLRGECEIESTEGKGTRFSIRLPLTLALFNGTLIEVRGQKYILPNSDYSETVSIKRKDIINSDRRKDIVKIRDKVLTVVSIDSILNEGKFRSFSKQSAEAESTPEVLIAAVTSHENEEYAVLFDEILAQEKVVLKKLGPETSQVRGISGGSILGDGSVALVLELKEIVDSGRRSAV